MNWLATDRLGRRWYPYIITDLEGKHRILMHREGADTDMGDLYLDELVEWAEPLTITLIKED
jgi:hypothetical protein